MNAIDPEVAAYHLQQSKRATEIYVSGMAPEPLALEWRQVTRTVRKAILRTIIDTNGLRDVYGTLTQTGKHILVLRHLFAPPISQDQLKLVAPLYPKGAEKQGSRLSQAAAQQFAEQFSNRRDKFLTPWLNSNAMPTRQQVKRLLDTVTPMISSQIFNTVRRNRLSDEQELAVEQVLQASGWGRVMSTTLESPSDVPAKSYMRKTRCRSSKTATKEVDIACGVDSKLILAMECKVSNDATNSVKRVNDVMDKVKSWNDTWASFIQTAALFQGVVLYKDVARMLSSEVEVFWSHDLDRFVKWLEDAS
ncbi:XamI restriction endonuclease [Sphingomonas sp. PP-CE-1A-559]|uniref:XamI family restriction endonuclease n=1 Tax=Sphingomonas sp. PP-CE-1A-559 TaxID=2135657 RepID=UPI001054A83A|nr:XamI family restriction endonuclease [Sphingomonas sp. PP-CE-1A-559]TCP93736.1 XamI restriction endonuclease [Sphingomonas sp. PP-CE-1A-559]